MSDYPKIDDFLDAVEDSTDQTWSSDIQHLYTEALKECVFADRVVKEMLPHQWQDWVIEGIVRDTPAGKWMSSMAPHFWRAPVMSRTSLNQVALLLQAGCALEHSNVGQGYLGVSGKDLVTSAIAKRLVQTDDQTIVDVLEAASKHTTNVGSTLLSALVDEHWDFNRVWDNPQTPQFQSWVQRMVKVSNGGSIFAPLVGGFAPNNLDRFSQWVVDFMISENGKKQKVSRDMQRFDQIFEQMPAEVAQKWIDHLSAHSSNTSGYGPLVSALLQNQHLRNALTDTPAASPGPEVGRRRM